MLSSGRTALLLWAIAGCGAEAHELPDATGDAGDDAVPDAPCETSCDATSDTPMDVPGDAADDATDATDGAVLIEAGEPCTASSACESGLCAPDSHGGVCVDTCASFLDCRSSETCAPIPTDANDDAVVEAWNPGCIATDGRDVLGTPCLSSDGCGSLACVSGQCTEVCSDDSECILGQVCRSLELTGASFSGCGYGASAAAVTLERIDLGTLEVHSTAELGPLIALPSDVSSVFLQTRSLSGPIPTTFVRVVDPLEEELFDLVELVEGDDQPVRWIPQPNDEVCSMLIPNSTSDRVVVRGGAYSFSIAHPSADEPIGTADVEVFVRRGDPDGSDLQIDLRIFLLGVGLSATTAASDTRLQRALTRVDQILSTQRISIGSVSYTELTGSDHLAVVNTVNGVGTEMAELLALAGTTETNAIDVFLVEEVLQDEETDALALGVAGGIPGPVLLHGNAHSGVVITFDEGITGSGTDGGDLAGQVIAHELSHYLGLYHVREANTPCGPGEMSTPEDPCAPFGGGDVLADTAPTDGDNLMYYRYGGGDGRTYNINLSAGQGYVLRRHPSVYLP